MPTGLQISEAFHDSENYARANNIEDSWEWIRHARREQREIRGWLDRDPREIEERKVKITQ